VEIQARSAEEATRLALEQLGATREQVDVQVLAETEDDIYGEGEVLIRVTVKGTAAAPRGDRQQGRGYGQNRGPGQGQPGRGGRSATDGRPRDSRPPRTYATGGQVGQGTQRRGGHGAQSQRNAYTQPSRPTPQRQPSQASDEATQRAETVAKQVVRELLSLMSIHADVMAVDNPSVMPVSNDDPLTVFVDINGRDLGMLIGRRGENLTQLQYMVNLLVNKRHDEWVRVIVDVEGYRSHREESLIGLAERVARQVARNRRPISLEPMPPNERRIVHMTLKELSDVRTESSGEGEMRRVTIYPV
jgi:spoIIIJ-associated protein